MTPASRGSLEDGVKWVCPVITYKHWPRAAFSPVWGAGPQSEGSSASFACLPSLRPGRDEDAGTLSLPGFFFSSSFFIWMAGPLFAERGVAFVKIPGCFWSLSQILVSYEWAGTFAFEQGKGRLCCYRVRKARVYLDAKRSTKQHRQAQFF